MNAETRRRGAALTLTLLLVLPLGASAAQITINNINAPGVGFNDPTPVLPAPGNPGLTRGQQRLNVFQRAADIIGPQLLSDIPIVVNAQFTTQECSANSGVLGSAGTQNVFRDFANAPVAGTWYHSALAKSLAGTNLGGAHDINANFNSRLDDDPACLGGVGWYYGLDHNQGNQSDLLAVVLHELSHGLGFQSLVSASTGAQLQGFPDTFSRNLFDNQIGLGWNAMSNAQRAASAINDPFLVWTGTHVTNRLDDRLARPPIVTINAPAGIAGNYEAQAAAYGPSVTLAGTTGNIVLVNSSTGVPAEGCGPLSNAAAIAGNIALVDRGSCNFSVKTINAQNAGAVGVIVANNAAGLPPMGGSEPAATIPSLGITQALGNSIRVNLPGVNATLRQDASAPLAGTNGGLIRMNAPNPLQPGSSVSHWSPAATPDLLMEPSITPNLTDDIDLTFELFLDIGWRAATIDLIFANGFE